MRILALNCELSANGEFLCYHAKGPNDGPFCAEFGGGHTISRLPWLSALTHPIVYMHGSKSRDALSSSDQSKLWELFRKPNTDTIKPWCEPLGPTWTPIPLAQAAQLGVDIGPSSHRAATCPLANTPITIVAVVNAQTDARGGRPWSIWHGDLQFSLVSSATPSHPVMPLPHVRWLHATTCGQLLIADDQATLKALRIDPAGDLTKAPKARFEHSLRTLTPAPGPAPAWAKAPLAPRA
jgi:hypothetical protein